MIDTAHPERPALSADYRIRYDAFIAGLNVVNLRIANAEIVAPNRYSAEAERPLQAHLATSSDYSLEPGGFTARSTLQFEGRYPDEEQPRISVRVTAEVQYSADAEVEADLLELFSARNLPLNTWPYLREFLQNALARAGWPVYTLPAFKPASMQLQLNLK